MKRILAILAIMALALGAAALAEAGEPAGILTLTTGTPVEADLDGDGAAETVSCGMVPVDEYDEHLVLTVASAEGGETTYETDILYGESAYIVDLDGDGRMEVLLTGDEMSDDYVTFCLRYDGGQLYELLFPDNSRSGESTSAYYKGGYGAIMAIEGNAITIAGSVDVLGTWSGSRIVALSPAGRFEFADDGIWRRDLSWLEEGFEDGEDPWDYVGLTLTRPLEYTRQDNGATDTLQIGDKIMITASDKQERAWFITRDGRTGVLSIEPDWESWGMRVNDIPEAECFEYIPYAD